jgi:hypothetical protein
MLKQCMSLEMLTVVMEMALLVKSHPDEKLQFQFVANFKLPEKLRFWVNLYG